MTVIIKIPQATVEFQACTYGGDDVTVSIRMEGGKGVRPPVIYATPKEGETMTGNFFGTAELLPEYQTKIGLICGELESICALTSL